MDVFVVNSFADVKLKSAGKGGFSDGGIESKSVMLKASVGSPAVNVDIAPPKGISYGGVTLGEPENQDEPNSVQAFNFDSVNDGIVTEYFVDGDGVETQTLQVPVAAATFESVGAFFEAGGVLTYPNKLRYKLTSAKPTLPSPVLLKYAVVLYDRPSDLG